MDTASRDHTITGSDQVGPNPMNPKLTERTLSWPAEKKRKTKVGFESFLIWVNNSHICQTPSVLLFYLTQGKEKAAERRRTSVT